MACGDGGAGATGGAGGTSSTTSGSTTSSSGSATTSSSTTSTTSTGTGGSPSYEPTGLSCSGAMPSLTNDIVPITTANCSEGAGCHKAAATANGFYDQFVMRIAEQCLDNRLMVDPGKPEQSYLIHKLTNHNICTGQTMPKDEAMLPSDQVQILYDWICNGAPKN
ncbi:Chitinase [Minicystis rosea]|nr:Chitinase [Minicystis rosea]